MSVKRKDSKNRILREGERQLADGRYCYRYKDRNGKAHDIYSWRLTPADVQPVNRRPCTSLRELEANAQANVALGMITSRATLNDMIEQFFDIRKDLSPSTRAQYMWAYKGHIRTNIGLEQVTKVDRAMLMHFIHSKLSDEKKSVGVLRSVCAVIEGGLQVAVDKHIISSNPAEKLLGQSKATRSAKSKHKNGLTKEEQERFLSFLRSSKVYCRYYKLFALLIGTGLRIGELLALQSGDFLFSTGQIYVHLNLQHYTDESGSYQFHIDEPKTEAGIRYVPMLDWVSDICKSLPDHVCMFELDGYDNFVFSQNGMRPVSARNLSRVLSNIIKACNEDAIENGVKTILPKFTIHSLRHTFCVRLCEGIHDIKDLKAVQYAMGHSSISVTMDIYNEVQEERGREIIRQLASSITLPA